MAYPPSILRKVADDQLAANQALTPVVEYYEAMIGQDPRTDLVTKQYLDPDAFQLPQSFALPAGANPKAVPTTMIGDAPRSAALNAWNPRKYNIDLSLRRSFNITPERVKFIFQVDCTNITNKVTFGGISTKWSPGSTSFGQVTKASGNRDFQFAGRINF